MVSKLKGNVKEWKGQLSLNSARKKKKNFQSFLYSVTKIPLRAASDLSIALENSREADKDSP